jgi:aerobic-type carbon monoxide dehydrogenase small subunit (CoxS/CutS family)
MRGAFPPMALCNVVSGGFTRTEEGQMSGIRSSCKKLDTKRERQNLGVDGRKILKWIVRNGLSFTDTRVGCLSGSCKPSGSVKVGNSLTNS